MLLPIPLSALLLFLAFHFFYSRGTEKKLGSCTSDQAQGGYTAGFLLSPGSTRQRTEQSSESVQETRHVAVTSVLRVTRATPAKASKCVHPESNKTCHFTSYDERAVKFSASAIESCFLSSFAPSIAGVSVLKFGVEFHLEKHALLMYSGALSAAMFGCI
jgi:hypothetical protein